MQKIEMTQEKLCTLRERLPWGAQREIAKRLDVSPMLVNKVLNGHWQNDKVIEATFAYLEEQVQRMQSLNEKIKQL